MRILWSNPSRWYLSIDVAEMLKGTELEVSKGNVAKLLAELYEMGFANRKRTHAWENRHYYQIKLEED